MTTVPPRPTSAHSPPAAVPRVRATRLILAALLGLASALLVACGSSSKGLIPASYAGPLQSDFETVQQAAENGDGNCATTEAALLKTSEDLTALPTTVDAGLRNNLRQGVANLRARALALCAQPLPQTTATNSTPPPTTTTTTTGTTTAPTITQTTPTVTSTTPTTTSPGGGTPAPGAGEAETPGAGGAQGGGTGVGEGESGNGKGNGNGNGNGFGAGGGQEAGK
jgi:hypothetical protein